VSFDGEAVWVIPGERMKQKRSDQGKPHRVPLSAAAVTTLLLAYRMATGTDATADDLPKLASLRAGQLIFPSRDPNKPLSDMSLSAVIRRMNEDQNEGTLPPWRDSPWVSGFLPDLGGRCSAAGRFGSGTGPRP
jgi:hypothetical protein